jgi:hypothetical protein
LQDAAGRGRFDFANPLLMIRQNGRQNIRNGSARRGRRYSSHQKPAFPPRRRRADSAHRAAIWPAVDGNLDGVADGARNFRRLILDTDLVYGMLYSHDRGVFYDAGRVGLSMRLFLQVMDVPKWLIVPADDFLLRSRTFRAEQSGDRTY